MNTDISEVSFSEIGDQYVNSEKLNDWMQIIAAAGVIGGLLLVAYELRQNTQHVIGETVRVLYVEYRTIVRSEYESDIAALVVKCIEQPQDLTDSEILEVSAYLTVIIGFYDQHYDLHELGVVQSSGLNSLKEEVDYVFTSRFGRAWFAANKDWMQPEVAETIERQLEIMPIRTTAPVENIRSQL